LARFDVKIISMTGNPKSFLASNSHVHLDVHVEQEACPLNLAPTSSTTAMLVLGDAIAMVLLEARGFKKEDFARFHPGGTLGRTLLLKVHQIMRKGDQIAIVKVGTPVHQVLREMTTRRAGAAIIADGAGKLAGVFAHSDFARHFQSDPSLGGKAVDEFMTRNPITIHADKLAAEVLHIIEHHRIDDIIVVDAENIPIGMVDSQDLARFKLL
ncbi:MAG: CBS domain-containing protein, partial [Verrucomicrobiota bacterium]|nr:CBS domain-containing protein [Verrucomicrobiota bacterium]